MVNKKAKMIKDGLSVSSRLLLAFVFIWASLHKIAAPYDFGLQVATYQILPLGLVNLQAIILPWLEIIVGVALIAGLLTRASALVTCGLNVMFIVAIAIALSNDLHLQCGCFASSDVGDDLTAGLIVRDAGLLVVGAFLVYVRPDRLTLDHLMARRKEHA